MKNIKKDSLKNILRNSNWIKVSSCYFFCILLCYMVFLKPVMTSDYIPGWFSSDRYRIDLLGPLLSGRFVNVIIVGIYKLLSYVRVSHYENTWVIQILGMLAYALACTIIYYLFSGLEELAKNEKYSMFFAILVGMVNPILIETYIYGAFDFGVGYLISMCGAKWLCERKYTRSLVAGFLAVSLYQSNIFLMLICVMMYYLACAMLNKISYVNFLKKEIWVAGFCLLICGVNLSIQKIGILLVNRNTLPEERITAVKNADINSISRQRLANLVDIITRVIKECYGMLPRLFIPILLGLIFSLVIMAACQKKRLFDIILFFIITILAGLSGFSFGLVTHPWYPQRTMLPLFLCLALALAVTVLYVFQTRKEYVRISYLVVMLTLFSLYYNTQVCNIDVFAAQKSDEDEARIINQLIENYENDSGIEVKTIAVGGGGGTNIPTTYCTKGLEKNYLMICPYHRIMYDTWAQVDYINYINATEYNEMRLTEKEVVELFGYETEGIFNPETQLIFRDDVLYWRVY